MAVTIQPMAQGHIAAIAALEEQCFSTPWSAAALAEELDNPHAVFRVATDADGQVLGYAGMHHAGDEGYIDNVAVDPAARRQGVARTLMAALEVYGREHTLYRLTLEVRASNAPAIALYTGAGYVSDGVRPNFYRKPTEDAVILSLYL
jgi:ribosomal-protein-alanine N-acetyltransferase